MTLPEICQKLHQQVAQLLSIQLNFLAEFLDFLQFKGAKVSASTAEQAERKPGLHPGAFAIGDDFDAPLPDSFWLGEE